MLNTISFLYPLWLWLLAIPLTGVIWLAVSGNRIRNKTGWIIRAVAFALLVLAASAPVTTSRGIPFHFVLIDVSRSIDANAANAAKQAVETLRQTYPRLQVREIGKEHSRLADAVLQVGAELRSQNGGTIHLFTDTGETDADLLRQCYELNLIGIPVEIQTFSAPRRGIILRHAALSPVAFQGQTGELKLTVAATAKATAQVTVKESGTDRAITAELHLQPGEKEYRLPVGLTAAGIHEFTVSLPDGQTVRAATFANPPYRVLLLSKHPDVDRELLRGIFGNAAVIDVDYQPGKLPEIALTVIGEGAAAALTPEVQRALAANLENGMGLLLFTGHEQPVADAAQPFPLAEALPVFFDRRNQQRTPTTALVVIIDTSGSMMGARIDLSKEVARLALERLRDCDKAGIVEFHGTRRWAAPLQSASNRLDIGRALNRLNAGGGTVILPAFQEAYYALRNCDARLKHVLVITDGGVEEGPFEPLVKKMAEHGITLSTVMVGPGKQSLFLSQLAQWGHGRFYQAANRFVLPELIFRQSGRDMLPAALEGELTLQVHDNLTRIAPVGALPPVDGILSGQAKTTADQLINAGGKLPFLSRWQYGLGQTAVITADLNGNWTAKLHRNTDYRKFLAALGRTLPDQGRFAPLSCVSHSVNRQLELEFADLAVAPSSNPLELHITRNGQMVEKFQTAAIAPGRWVVRHEPLPEGVYRIDANIKGNAHNVIATVALANAPEINRLTPDTDLIGAVNRASAALPPPAAALYERYWRPWLGFVALILFIIQILLRRLPEISSSRVRHGNAAVLALLLLPLYGFAQPGEEVPAWNAAFSGDYDKALKIFPDKAEYQAQLSRGTFAGQAGRYQDAVAAYHRAADLADTGRNRRFALLLELQSARKAGTVPALLDSWQKNPQLDRIRTELIADELEDNGRFAEALAFIRSYWSRTQDKSVRLQQQLIRLAEKCGQPELIRNLYRQSVVEQPQAITPVAAWGRFELLAGHRDVAAQIYHQAINRNRDPAVLLALAAAAEQSALDHEAIAAAEKAALAGPQIKRQSLFFEAKLQFRRGHPDHALKILGTITDGADPAELMAVAELYEQFGALDRAIETYRASSRKSGDEHGLIRAAMIEENRGNNKAASVLWRKILAASSNPVTIDQAAIRVIELAETDRTLPQLQQEFEVKSGQKLADKELLFLARIHVANKALSSLEKLFATQRKLQPSKLLSLLQTELQCVLNVQQYARAEAILRELIECDSAHRDDYLRQQASLAIETGNKELAEQSVAALEKQFKDQCDALEFSAGIAAMMNDYPRAASIYEQCLARYPDRIETWLSWASALKKCNRTEEAIPVLLGKAAKATAADEFGVMIDGLIDLQPPQPILAQALTLVKQRLAADSANIFYYRLAGDLAEDLNDRELQQRLHLYSIIVSPADRVLVLRLLMQEAVHANNREAAIEYGLTLCGLDEILPVDLYQSLGNLLLAEKRYSTAERIFKLADQGEDNYTEVQMQMAAAYRDAGMLTDAERIIRELLIVDPDNIPLHVESASMLEIDRRYAAAAEHYYFVLNLLVSRQLSAVAAKSRHHRNGNHNVSDAQRWLEPITRALVHCCSMVPGNIADRVGKSLNAELAALDKSKTQPTSIDATPKLKSWSELYRRINFRSGKVAAADDLDHKLLRRFPDDAALREDLVRDRLEFGLYDRAREFAGNTSGSLRPYNERVVKLLLGNQLPEAAALLEKQIKALPISADEKNFADLAGFAIVLDRPDLLTEISSKWLAAAWQKGGKPSVVRCLELVYNSLPSDALRSLLANIETHYDQRPAAERLQLAWILRQASLNQLIPATRRDVYEKELLENSATSADRILAIVQDAPSANRPALVNLVLAHRPANRLAAFIVELAGNLPFESDRALDDTLSGAFAKNFTGKDLPLWQERRYGHNLQRRISDTALGKSPESIPLLAASALARNRDGDYSGALALVREIIDRLVENKKIDYQTVNLIDSLPRIFQADTVADGLKRRTDRDRLLKSAADTALIVGDNSAAYLVAGIFARGCGNDRSAAEILRTAWTKDTGSLTAIRNLFDVYDKNVRWSELRRELIQRKPESPEAQFFYNRQLSQIQKNLFYLPEAESSAAGLIDYLKAIQLTGVALTVGDPAKVSRTVIRFYLDQRNRNHASPAFGDFLPSSGGIDGFRRKGDLQKQSLYTLMAEMNLTAELEYILKGADLNDRSVGALFVALRSCRVPEEKRQRLHAEALRKLPSHTLSATELLIAVAANASQTDPAIVEALAELAADPSLEPELATEIINVLPPAQRLGATLLQLQRFIVDSRRGFGRNNAVVRSLTRLPEGARQQLAAIVIRATRPAPFVAAADNTDVDRLLFLKRTAPALLPTELATLATSLNRDEQPILALLLDDSPNRIAAISRFIRQTVNDRNDDAVLPWEQIVPLLSDAYAASFWLAVPSALEEAFNNNLLSESDLVRNYAWLAVQAQAVGQSAVARNLLDTAQRHHREPGEPTLWLIDARLLLGLPADSALENALIERQQLPPVRLGKIISARPELQSPAKALELSRWTHHPEVLRRALPAAKPGPEKQELERALEFYQPAIR